MDKNSIEFIYKGAKVVQTHLENGEIEYRYKGFKLKTIHELEIMINPGYLDQFKRKPEKTRRKKSKNPKKVGE